MSRHDPVGSRRARAGRLTGVDVGPGVDSTPVSDALALGRGVSLLVSGPYRSLVMHGMGPS